MAGTLLWRPPPRLPGAGISSRLTGVAAKLILGLPPWTIERAGGLPAAFLVAPPTVVRELDGVDAFLGMAKHYR